MHPASEHPRDRRTPDLAHAAPGRDIDVLVVGAGPTGLTAACEAMRYGLSTRIIDRKPSRSAFSKALVVHARTMEVFETMGIADRILVEGARFTALNVNTARRRPVRVDLLGLPWGDTAYPFWLSVPQFSTERVLETHLAQSGGRVEWETTLEDVHDRGDRVEATVQHGSGRREVIRAHWLVACDGGRSRVRDTVGLHLNRTDAKATFVLADIKTTAHLKEDEGHVFLASEGLLLIVPMPEPRRWRIIAHVPQTEAQAALQIDEAFFDELIQRRSGIEFGSHDLAWTSRFQLSHGLADHYRQGRVFLAGDAAHIHSPVGGQGLNTGVQDAHNLLWKLAEAQRVGAAAAEGLLDSYEAERQPVARAMVRGTARATSALTTRTGVTRALLGLLAPTVLARQSVQARFGRGVGMLDIAYATPRAALTPGRRIPNPPLRGGGRLHHRLASGFSWVARERPSQKHPAPADPCWMGIPVVFLSDKDLTDSSGLTDGPPVTLVRPDRYIAATGSSPESALSEMDPPLLLSRRL